VSVGPRSESAVSARAGTASEVRVLSVKGLWAPAYLDSLATKAS